MKDCCGQEIVPIREMSIHTNRHPSTDGTDWGWIDGCTVNICWANNHSFNRAAAVKYIKEYEQEKRMADLEELAKQAQELNMGYDVVKKEVKQVIVVRKNYPDGKGGIKKLRRGKEISQAAHASISFLTRRIQKFLEDKGTDFSTFVSLWISVPELEWINGLFTKVCVTVDSEEELLEIEKKANEAGIECHLITDRGLTEFNGIPTVTCLALGPDDAEKIDAITRELKLY